MPSASRQTAAESMRMFGLEARLSNLEGGFTVSFETHTSDEDLGPVLEGLPDEECRFVKLGYVIRGTAEFSPTDHLGKTIGVLVANIQRGRGPVNVTEGDQ